MKNLKHYFTLTCSMLLMLSLSMPALAQGQKAETLVGHWTFEPGEELKDLTGNFVDITLKGAEVKGGQLDVGVGKWAVTSGYKGPDIKEKTLVSWAYLDSLDVQGGSILTINRVSDPTFDAIVFGERQPHRWMAGSGWFHRTQDAVPGFEEKKKGELIQMAISYEDVKGTAHVRIYHNGDLIGDYTFGQFEPFKKNDTAAIWGKRHDPAGGPGDLDAHIEDSRIYATVLSQDEIKALRPDSLQVEARGKLTTLWGAIKAK